MLHPWATCSGSVGSTSAGSTWDSSSLPDLDDASSAHSDCTSESDSEDEFDPAPTALKAGQILFQFLLNLYMLGSLSAKSLCLLCFYCAKAGAVGSVIDLARPPGAHTGNYQKFIDRKLGFDVRDAHDYYMDLPGHHKHDVSRSIHRKPVVPAHESLRDEVDQNPSILDELARKTKSHEWPASYYDHPVVKSSETPTLPYALYCDGAPYSKNDGFVVFTVCNLVTLKRHIVALLLKANLCQCGCRGWCSIWPLMCQLRWSFAALAKGENPAARHDNSKFGAKDKFRKLVAGVKWLWNACLLRIGGDWMEFASTFGFPAWNSICPCLFCGATRNNMYDVTNVMPNAVAWPEHTSDEYDKACRDCEIYVSIDKEQHVLIVANLQPDSRLHTHGRTLQVDIPALLLRKKDRLEPCTSVPDTGTGFDNLSCFPATVLFWRASCETRARHRNPIIDPEIGISTDTFHPDSMHSLNLGVWQQYCMHLFWKLLLINAWAVRAPNLDTQRRLCILRLRQELFDWYKANPRPGASRLQNLTFKMLGTEAKKKLKTKAAETKELTRFCVHLCASHKKALGAEYHMWHTAGQCLVKFMAVMDGHGQKLPDSAIQDRTTSLSHPISQSPSQAPFNLSTFNSRLTPCLPTTKANALLADHKG